MKRNPIIPFATIAVLGIVLMIVLGAFGMNEVQKKQAENDEPKKEQKSNMASQPPEKIYSNNCASCHGDNLQGAMGPKLKGNDLSKDAIQTQIKEGGGGMPPGVIKGEAAQKVAEWLTKQ